MGASQDHIFSDERGCGCRAGVFVEDDQEAYCRILIVVDVRVFTLIDVLLPNL